MRTKIVVASLTAVFVGGVGVAWAVLGGNIVVPSIAQGLAGSNPVTSCQTTNVNFNVPDPTFNQVSAVYQNTTIDFSQFAADCVTNTATLEVQVLDSTGAYLATGTTVPSGTTGTLTISPAVEFSAMSTADIIYLVIE